MERLIFRITFLVLCSVNISVHTIGSYILISLYRNGHNSIQRLFITNLSITEAILNLLGVLSIMTNFISHGSIATSKPSDAADYVNMANYTGIGMQYLLMMIYITIDRLLEVYLNIKYPLYCKEKHAKRLIVLTWFTSAGLTLGVSLAHKMSNFAYKEPFFAYVLLPLSVIFVSSAICTYISIFRKYRQTRVHPVHSVRIGNTRNGVNTFTVFRRSKFYVPVLLISTFIFFVEIPSLVYIVLSFIYSEHSYILESSYEMFMAISTLSDFFIYIFFQSDVRKRFWKIIKHCDYLD